MTDNTTYSKWQLWALVVLRLAIGWHFLYEGVVKVLNPNWSSLGYLMDSKGLFEGFFHNIAANPGLLSVMDFMNQWGLVLIGAGLIVGLFTRLAAYAGMLLLAFYYLSHPAIIGADFAMPTEGSYLWINKNLIELLTLWVLTLFPTWKEIGLDRFLFNKN